MTLGSQLQLVVGTVPTSTPLYWSGAVDASWSTDSGVLNNTNWLNGPAGTEPQQVPGSITDVYFTANSATRLTTTLDAAFTINSLTFTGMGTSADASNVTINPGAGGASSTLTINALAEAYLAGTGIVDNSTSAAHTINANVILGGNQSWTNNSSGTFTVAGNVSSPGNFNSPWVAVARPPSAASSRTAPAG